MTKKEMQAELDNLYALLDEAKAALDGLNRVEKLLEKNGKFDPLMEENRNHILDQYLRYKSKIAELEQKLNT